MSQSERSFPWETPPELWRGFKPGHSSSQGSVVSIYISPNPSGSMVSTPQVRAFADRSMTNGAISHAADKGYPELTADEHYLLILNIDMGGQFFFRENLNTAGSATP